MVVCFFMIPNRYPFSLRCWYPLSRAPTYVDNLRVPCVIVEYCFFFQAEDGIRDIGVTGVQTCALPILPSRGVDDSVHVQPDHPDQRAGGAGKALEADVHAGAALGLALLEHVG